MTQFLQFILFFAVFVKAQEITILGNIEAGHPDGPFIFYTSEGVKIISVSDAGLVTQVLYPGSTLPEGFTFEVISEANEPGSVPVGRSAFKVTVQSEFHRPPSFAQSPDSLIVISDPHAKWMPFVSILKAHGVIDDGLNWSFGNNQLMIIGDIYDRGTDAVTIFWMTYELQRQARNVGGEVYFIIGNHEDMRIKGQSIDTDGYVDAKYKRLAAFLSTVPAFGSAYSTFNGKFFDGDTEVGRWIRDSASAMQIIGTDLYVHGGISQSVFALKMSVEDINLAVAAQILSPTRTGAVVTLLNSSSGLLWYRGMVPGRDDTYTYEDVLAPILRFYRVERVIIGHSEVQAHSSGETEYSNNSPLPYVKYDYRVVNVNVQTANAMAGNYGRGALLLQNGETYAIYDAKPNTVVNLPTRPIPDADTGIGRGRGRGRAG